MDCPLARQKYFSEQHPSTWYHDPKFTQCVDNCKKCRIRNRNRNNGTLSNILNKFTTSRPHYPV